MNYCTECVPNAWVPVFMGLSLVLGFVIGIVMPELGRRYRWQYMQKEK